MSLKHLICAIILLVSAGFGEAFAQEADTEIPNERGASGRINIPLSGSGLVQRNSQLSISPVTLALDNVEIGESETQTITLFHDGDEGSGAVDIGEAEIVGQNANEFSTQFTGFVTLFPGESMDISVTFTPVTAGRKSAGMRISIVDATAPYILVFSAEASFALASRLAISDAQVSFGEILLGETSSANVILRNEGESDAPAISVSQAVISGTNADDFSINFQSTSLAPGEELDVQITLSSDIAGPKSASVEFISDATNSALQLQLAGSVNSPDAVPINFSLSALSSDQEVNNPTTLQFGPDGRLYVGEMNGPIHIFNIERDGKDNYTATLDETINLIRDVINHNDDGTRDFASIRLMTGIHVSGTAASPVIYAASSDPRQAAGPSGNDSGLDTNSGILHRLTKNGGSWSKLDLVRGLPRSEENHVSNGLVLVDNKIYLNVGGHTNHGLPSNNFAELPEYALSAAVLEIDLGMIGESTYDIPTLDVGAADEFDPFGGHDGLNQAKLVEGGPISIFSSGIRNAYDLSLIHI